MLAVNRSINKHSWPFFFPPRNLVTSWFAPRLAGSLPLWARTPPPKHVEVIGNNGYLLSFLPTDVIPPLGVFHGGPRTVLSAGETRSSFQASWWIFLSQSVIRSGTPVLPSFSLSYRLIRLFRLPARPSPKLTSNTLLTIPLL